MDFPLSIWNFVCPDVFLKLHLEIKFSTLEIENHYGFLKNPAGKNTIWEFRTFFPSGFWKSRSTTQDQIHMGNKSKTYEHICLKFGLQHLCNNLEGRFLCHQNLLISCQFLSTLKKSMKDISNLTKKSAWTLFRPPGSTTSRTVWCLVCPEWRVFSHHGNSKRNHSGKFPECLQIQMVKGSKSQLEN